jgi:hypothetical protein
LRGGFAAAPQNPFYKVWPFRPELSEKRRKGNLPAREKRKKIFFITAAKPL